MTQNLSDSRLAHVGATTLLAGFVEYHDRFKVIRRRARARFEGCEWQGMLADSIERLELQNMVLAHTVEQIRELLGERVTDHTIWVGIKAVYSSLLTDRNDWEIAETFYNSVTRRIFTTVGVDAQIEFVDTDFDAPPTSPRTPIERSYPQASTTAG